MPPPSNEISDAGVRSRHVWQARPVIGRRLRTKDGVFLLVAAQDVMEIGDDAQAAAVASALVRDLAGARWARDFAGSWNALTSADATAYVARALRLGTLVVVRIPTQTRQLDAPRSTALSDLAEQRLPPPSRPAAVPVRDEVEPLTWVSFEAVDPHGQPVTASYRVGLDAKTEDGRTEAVHRYDELRPGVNAQLVLWDIEFRATHDAPPAPSGPAPTPTPRPGELTFECVDEAGRPVALAYEVEVGERRIAGQAAGVTRVEVGEAEGVRLTGTLA
jgi:hypothetical protein